MGYRHYFYSMKKSDYDEIANMTIEEITDKYGDKWEYNEKVEKSLSMLDLPMHTIFEFGKLYWDDTAERIYSKGVPLFSNKDIQAHFDEEDPYNVGEEGIIEAIDIYINKIKLYYKNLLSEDGVNYAEGDKYSDIFKGKINIPDKIANELFEDARQKYIEWNRLLPVNTNIEDKVSLCNSWLFEYEVFELAHILKTFDFENNYLIFLGY